MLDKFEDIELDASPDANHPYHILLSTTGPLSSPGMAYSFILQSVNAAQIRVHHLRHHHLPGSIGVQLADCPHDCSKASTFGTVSRSVSSEGRHDSRPRPVARFHAHLFQCRQFEFGSPGCRLDLQLQRNAARRWQQLDDHRRRRERQSLYRRRPHRCRRGGGSSRTARQCAILRSASWLPLDPGQASDPSKDQYDFYTTTHIQYHFELEPFSGTYTSPPYRGHQRQPHQPLL